MELLQSLAVIILILLLVQYILINVLKIPYSDLIPVPGRIGVEAMTSNKEIDLSDLGADLKRQYGITDELPQGDYNKRFVQQAVYDPNSAAGSIVAANQDIYDKPADFGNEQTNVAQFFASNPGAFVNDQRHTAYVGDAANWNDQGKQLYSQMLNAPHATIQAFNCDQHLTPVTVV